MTELRWRNYVLSRDEQFGALWSELRDGADRSVLYILGLGFDERMCLGLRGVLEASKRGKVEVCLLTFDEGQDSPSQSHRSLRDSNESELKALVATHGCVCNVRNIKLVSTDGRRLGGRSVARAFSAADLSSFTDVVVDISALPRGLYFPLVVKMLTLFDHPPEAVKQTASTAEDAASEEPVAKETKEGSTQARSNAKAKGAANDSQAAPKQAPVADEKQVPAKPAVATQSIVRNLHVVVAHSPVLDSATHDEGIDEDATYLFGFSAAEFEREATREQPRVWLPILGRGQRVQLDRILELVTPDEICPVVPSPSANAREADDLMLEYRQFLFDQLRVEPRNVIYASEANPFEVYRQIMRSVRHYHRALSPLSGCKAVVSAMSSKLASIGALLAAYELRGTVGSAHVDVGVAHVETQGYRFERPADVPSPSLFNLWLAGECHAQ